MSGSIPGIHTLPDEILDEIFTMGCQLDLDFGLGGHGSERDNWLPEISQIIAPLQHCGGRQPKPFPRLARLVCKRWNLICVQQRNSHLWITSITINSGEHDWAKQFAIAKERLLSSRNSNIDITIYFGFSAPETGRLPDRTRLCLHFWRLLLEYQSQWRFVRLQTGIAGVLGVLFCDLNALKETSNLLWISINDDGNGFESGYYRPDVTNPSLHLYVSPLQVETAELPMSMVHLSGLLHLSTQAVELSRLDLPTGLRSLSLVTWQVGASRKILPWHELVHTLRQGSHIERLDLCLMDISDMPSYPLDYQRHSQSLSSSSAGATDEVLLRSLQHIHLEGMLPQLLVFLTVFKMPQLETLNVTFFGESTSDMKIPQLTINSFPRLKRIATRHTEVHELMFLSMLDMPTLESVDLRLYWQSNGDFVWPDLRILSFVVPPDLKLVNAKPADFFLLFNSADLSVSRSLHIGPSSSVPGHGSSGTKLESLGVLHFPELRSLSIISPPLSDLGGYLKFIDAPALEELLFEKMSDIGEPPHEDWIDVCRRYSEAFRKLTKIKFFCPRFDYEASGIHPNPFSFFPAIEELDVTFRRTDDLLWMERPIHQSREGKRKRKKLNPPIFTMLKRLRELTITITSSVEMDDSEDNVFARARKLFATAENVLPHSFALRLKTRSRGMFDVEETLRLGDSIRILA